MARPWQTLERVETPDGVLELRRRGALDFLITLDGRVIMTSVARRSEQALARLGCAALPTRRAPRLLIGGLGMGCTLRAALDAIPPGGRIIVAELNPCVVEWCRGPLAPLSRAALDDPRVTVAVADVGSVLAEAAPGSLEGVLLDLYEGPRVGGDAIFGGPGVERIGAALAPGGVLAVWSEAPVPAFERRLVRAGFEVERTRAGRGGRRHAITVARRPAARRGTQREAGSRGGPRRGRAARVPTSGA